MTRSRRRDGAAGGLLDHVAVLVADPEKLLRHRVVVAGGGAGEEVVGEAQGREVLSLMDVNGDGMFSKAIGDPVDTDALRRALVKRGRLAPESPGETPDQTYVLDKGR